MVYSYVLPKDKTTLQDSVIWFLFKSSYISIYDNIHTVNNGFSED